MNALTELTVSEESENDLYNVLVDIQLVRYRRHYWREAVMVTRAPTSKNLLLTNHSMERTIKSVTEFLATTFASQKVPIWSKVTKEGSF